MLGGKKKTTRRRKPTKAVKKRVAKTAIKRHFASGGSIRDFWHKHKGKLALAGLTLPTLAAAWMLFGKNTPEVLANDERIHDPIFEEEKARNPSILLTNGKVFADNPDFVLEYEGDGRHPKAEADDDADYAYNLGLQYYRDSLLKQRTPQEQAAFDDYEALHSLGYYDEEGYDRLP